MIFAAETWFAILFITIVDVSTEKVKTTVLGIFLFLMNNIGGNLPVIIHPISQHFGYRYLKILLNLKTYLLPI